MESDPNQPPSAKSSPKPSPKSEATAKAPSAPGHSGRPGALGRGLDALLPSSASSGVPDAIRRLPVAQIDPNPYQPRRNFDPVRLKELADSIKLHGVVQPVVVRKQGDRYLLIAGERRLRASKLAGIAVIPSIVRDVPESSVLELTLIENIQREDLNPIETADAFARLAVAFNLTHEEIAARTGKDRASVTNFLRLLKLPEEVRDFVATGELTMGHARTILALPTESAQKALAMQILREGLSVRATETVAKSQGAKTKSKFNTVEDIEKDAVQNPNVQAAIHELERALGTRVKLIGNDMYGKIVIEYYSSEDLDRVYNHILGRK